MAPATVREDPELEALDTSPTAGDAAGPAIERRGNLHTADSRLPTVELRVHRDLETPTRYCSA
ncbi:hypothetical protein SAMN05216360_10741 [Methylobacterium phyllostachyos]|uniref:Uncharacterized protein n=1 Tax=Methylobacterium phyllostachyos TaxID=582672 RepID=A0A1H0A2F5_9HYPH|nr:hypothetical protein SAMN05216360_10741 [Methylobacterium phyllostachyos]